MCLGDFLTTGASLFPALRVLPASSAPSALRSSPLPPFKFPSPAPFSFLLFSLPTFPPPSAPACQCTNSPKPLSSLPAFLSGGGSIAGFLLTHSITLESTNSLGSGRCAKRVVAPSPVVAKQSNQATAGSAVAPLTRDGKGDGRSLRRREEGGGRSNARSHGTGRPGRSRLASNQCSDGVDGPAEGGGRKRWW